MEFCKNFTHLPIVPGFIRSSKGKRCRESNVDVLNSFIPPSGKAVDAMAIRDECEIYCSTHDNCWGCSVYCGSPCQWNAIPNCEIYDDWTGLIEGDITQKPGNNKIHMLPT